MLGPSHYSAKGKTKQTQPDTVDVTLKKINVPKTIRQFYNKVELGANVMFINDVPFLLVFSIISISVLLMQLTT